MISPDSLFFRFVTVDTNVKEDRFVVQKTTHSFQNWPPIKSKNPVVAAIPFMLPLCRVKGNVLCGETLKAPMAYGLRQHICTRSLYFIVENWINSHSLLLYTILYQMKVCVPINFVLDVLLYQSLVILRQSVLLCLYWAYFVYFLT